MRRRRCAASPVALTYGSTCLFTILLFATGAVHAQTCVGTTDIVCTNTGPNGSFSPTLQTGTTALTNINTSTGTATGISTATEYGDATVINDGIVNGNTSTGSGVAQTTSRVTSTTINNGTVNGSMFTIVYNSDVGAITYNNGKVTGSIRTALRTGGFGDAKIFNTGLASGLLAFNEGFGDTIIVNSGTTVLIEATNFGGANAIVDNSGQTNSITTESQSGDQLTGAGMTKTTNSGTVKFGITTTGAYNLAGTATTINSGFVGGDINTTARSFTGAATTTNEKSGIAQNITTSATQFGTATTTNLGRANNLISVANQAGASVVNAGIAGSGSALVSATSDAGPASVLNSGSIYGSVAATSTGGPASVVNSGSIYRSVAATSTGGPASMVNSGTIRGLVTVTSSYTGGAGPGSFLTNAGLIDGTGYYAAIDVTADVPDARMTLNLLPGSRIIGRIVLASTPGDPASVGTTVNIGGARTASAFLTFGDSNGESGLLDGSRAIVSNAIYVISGNSVALVDPTSFAVASRNIVDVTHTIGSLASGRLANPASATSEGLPLGFAPSGNVARDMANEAFAAIPGIATGAQDRVLMSNPNLTTADGSSVWAQGFGGRRIASADGPLLRSVNSFYGGVLGIDKTVQPTLRLGAFVGGGNVQSDIDLNSGSTTSNIGFGGIYGRYRLNEAFVDFSLLGGGSSNQASRRVDNNLATGGIERATANYGGWFVSPELAYGIDRALGSNLTLTPTVRLRYLAAGFGSYREAGSAAALTVASQTTRHFEERAGVTLARRFAGVSDGALQLSVSAGGIALQRAGGGNINAILLGQSLAFATPGRAGTEGYYTGAGIDWRHASGMSLFAAAEFNAMSDASRTIAGRGGLRIAF